MNPGNALFVNVNTGKAQPAAVTNSGQLILNATYPTDSPATFGEAKIVWDGADANANALKIGLPDGGSVNVPAIHIGRKSDIIGIDLTVGNGLVKPQIYHWDNGNGRYHRQGWQVANPVFYEFVLSGVNQYFFGSIVNFGAATLFPANVIRYIGSVYEQYRNTGVNPAHYLSFPANIPYFITTVANNGVQYSKGTTFANPKMYFTSGTSFATSVDEWGAIEHDKANFLITAGTGMIVKNSVETGIAASTTQTQGQQPLTKNINEVATVANANDVVTAPSAYAGADIYITNNGANTLQIFPASGDDLGAGVDTSVTLAAGSSVHYVAIDGITWISL